MKNETKRHVTWKKRAAGDDLPLAHPSRRSNLVDRINYLFSIDFFLNISDLRLFVNFPTNHSLETNQRHHTILYQYAYGRGAVRWSRYCCWLGTDTATATTAGCKAVSNSIDVRVQADPHPSPPPKPAQRARPVELPRPRPAATKTTPANPPKTRPADVWTTKRSRPCCKSKEMMRSELTRGGVVVVVVVVDVEFVRADNTAEDTEVVVEVASEDDALLLLLFAVAMTAQ